MCVRYIVHVYITNIHVHVQSTNHISLLKHRDRYYIVHKVAHAEVPYSRELVKKNIFWGENFHRLLAFAKPKDDATPPNFIEKSFANSHKTVKFEVFSLESFPLYGTCWPTSDVTLHQLDWVIKTLIYCRLGNFVCRNFRQVIFSSLSTPMKIKRAEN